MTTPTEQDDPRIASVATYYHLGRSGLRISPITLGTMTFGNKRFGHDDATARQILDRYLELGGNSIDTADAYGSGRSEELLGEFMQDAGNRDRLVLATKFNFNPYKSDPNGGGNSRKHILEAVEDSLRRLRTDYIDLYWMHNWDTLTPVEEVVSTLSGLVRDGKIRYYGFSDTPAWYTGRAHGLAEAHGLEKPVAMQLEYSLAVRDIEYEFVPAAKNLGMGILPWSPLASGLLTGKYSRDKVGEGRLKEMNNSGNPVFDKLNEENFKVLDVLLEVAKEVDRHPAQVALNWVTRRPGVTSTIIGATSVKQLDSNLGSLEFDLPEKALKRLEEAGAPRRMTPYVFHEGVLHKASVGDRPVAMEPPWFR